MSRYQINSDEGEFQPGSNGKVLRNLVDIDSPDDMNDLELILLNQLYIVVLMTNIPRHRLSVDDIKEWHRQWLGNVYAWAGQERSVNMSKGDFLFAPASQIPRLFSKLQEECLDQWTPCFDMEEETLIEAIAVTHVEFILIHPFREGNGRLARLLADVMAAQAGRSPLDYSVWEAERERYIGAIHAGLGSDYRPMKRLVAEALGLAKTEQAA